MRTREGIVKHSKYGLYQYAEGRQHFGAWKDGEKHGPGIEWTMKRIEAGDWENGQQISSHHFVFIPEAKEPVINPPPRSDKREKAVQPDAEKAEEPVDELIFEDPPKNAQDPELEWREIPWGSWDYFGQARNVSGKWLPLGFGVIIPKTNNVAGRFGFWRDNVRMNRSKGSRQRSSKVSEQRGFGTKSYGWDLETYRFITGYWVNGDWSDDKPKIIISVSDNSARFSWPARNKPEKYKQITETTIGQYSFEGWLNKGSRRGFGVIMVSK